MWKEDRGWLAHYWLLIVALYLLRSRYLAWLRASTAWWHVVRHPRRLLHLMKILPKALFRQSMWSNLLLAAISSLRDVSSLLSNRLVMVLMFLLQRSVQVAHCVWW